MYLDFAGRVAALRRSPSINPPLDLRAQGLNETQLATNLPNECRR